MNTIMSHDYCHNQLYTREIQCVLTQCFVQLYMITCYCQITWPQTLAAGSGACSAIKTHMNGLAPQSFKLYWLQVYIVAMCTQC